MNTKKEDRKFRFVWSKGDLKRSHEDEAKQKKQEDRKFRFVWGKDDLKRIK